LEKDWTGLCYMAALQWATEADEDDWLVVHGMVFSERSATTSHNPSAYIASELLRRVRGG